AGAAHANQQRQSPDEPMTVKRAAEILGVDENASSSEIRAAHKKLMGKVHPDKDGTDYLAALINEARDFLIARHQDT
ncbi:MAG: DnaJ domain-containing protein, partial [Litorivicinaceae bacterium]